MKVRASLLSIALVAAVALPSAARSQTDAIKETLESTLVEIVDGRFVLNRYVLCEVSLPRALGGGTPFHDFQTLVRSEAPAEGLISRDYFVVMSVILYREARRSLARLIPGLTTEQALEVLRCRDAARPIKPDTEYTLTIVMHAEGVTSTIRDNVVGTEQQTRRDWQETLNLPPGRPGG